MTAVVAAPHRPVRPLRLVGPTVAPRRPLDGLAPTGSVPAEASGGPAVDGPPARPRLEVVAGGRSVVARRRLAALARSLASLAPALPRVSALAVVALLATTVAALVIATTSADPRPAPGTPRPTPAAAAVPAEPQPVAARTYVVQPGDSLWGIARSLQPTGDIRPLVDELARRLGDRTLQPGMHLALDGLAVR